MTGIKNRHVVLFCQSIDCSEKRNEVLFCINVFFSGATGSGKTTSLYSLIHHCTTLLHRHVISLEDPVENNQVNLLQIQVNERAGVTYATGLKAILRHSPDVIMIGEIRDKETAHIAIEAALTGHLVLSTIHAKDAVSCLYRLLDLGITLEDLRLPHQGRGWQEDSGSIIR